MNFRHTIPTTSDIEYIYLDLLLIYDIFNGSAVFVKLSELEPTVIIIRQDCQKILLILFIVLLNYLIIYRE